MDSTKIKNYNPLITLLMRYIGKKKPIIQLVTFIAFLLLPCINGYAQHQEKANVLFIEAYTGWNSYVPGEEVGFHVSTSAPTFSMKIARVGKEAEVVWEQSGLKGSQHLVPENASSHGCGWPTALKVEIPDDWESGYYEVSLFVEDKGGKFFQRGRRTAEGRCFFVVKSAHPGRDTKILLQLTTNTYNAYNNWGGSSLYYFNGRGNLQGYRVSFDRPPASQFFMWELPFVMWAEENGYKIDYAVNSDLEFNPELLDYYRLVLSVGHDEYWSTPMRDNLEAFIADGGNVAFFSGNTCCWQVRSEDEGRALTSWKENYPKDPFYGLGHYPLVSTLWSHHLLGRPENEMTGVGFLKGGFHKSQDILMKGSGAFTVHRPNHWVFKGTGLKRGDEFGGNDTIVGYECDGCELEWRDGLPFPTNRDGTPESFSVLCTAPARWQPSDAQFYELWSRDDMGAACLGIYTQGGTVFTAATTDWSHGLSGGDPIVMQITKNILDRLSK